MSRHVDIILLAEINILHLKKKHFSFFVIYLPIYVLNIFCIKCFAPPHPDTQNHMVNVLTQLTLEQFNTANDRPLIHSIKEAISSFHFPYFKEQFTCISDSTVRN
ncbi:UNVERIFIED_CONTAM: hypothetical protein K2H54_049159 [Gekko kuhli]